MTDKERKALKKFISREISASRSMSEVLMMRIPQTKTQGFRRNLASRIEDWAGALAEWVRGK